MPCIILVGTGSRAWISSPADHRVNQRRFDMQGWHDLTAEGSPDASVSALWCRWSHRISETIKTNGSTRYWVLVWKVGVQRYKLMQKSGSNWRWRGAVWPYEELGACGPGRYWLLSVRGRPRS